MNPFTRRVLFVSFFLSGFSSLVCQVVWTRMAFASFGIITPVLSVVLSVFMLGLALGSWAGGRWISSLSARTALSAAFFYAGVELIIGLGAFAVPKLFAAGENVLLASGETDSFGYLALSALVLAMAILPWTFCMGCTFPFMMAFIREQERDQTKSFSFLYLANVLGAMSGTFLAAIIYIELLGFHHTLWVAAAGNFAVAFISGCLGAQQRQRLSNRATGAAGPTPASITPAGPPDGWPAGTIKWILFSTGFIAMAMEVVWTRAFTPVLKTQVYSFALIVFVYLGSTFLGSWVDRRDLRLNRSRQKAMVIALLAVSAFVPVLVNNPEIMVANHASSIIDLRSAVLLLAAIIPFCALLGYLTPGLIDEYAGGTPARAGTAYAINVVGCILGPLFACYCLLPNLSERHALILLALPFFLFCFQLRQRYSPALKRWLRAVAAIVLFWSTVATKDYENVWAHDAGSEAVVHRDYAATVVSLGQGWQRRLLVNGTGMTALTSMTKFMAHLPLAFHQRPPESALVICFGMGTSYRSAMSWNIDTTAVELVPGVTKAFAYYHGDAARFLEATNGHIVIDDGRRFLKRTTKKFDVIVVDPPPPVQAAGSSLLFSTDFYTVAKQHLKPGGIVQMWVPGDVSLNTGQAAMRSMCESFPNVRCFKSVANWGVHMLGSMEPIESFDADQLAARMPDSARRDLTEWFKLTNSAALSLRLILKNEIPVADVLNPDPAIRITDDKPYNEYYLLRYLERDN